VLERAYPRRQRVGHAGPPRGEVVRFRAHLSLNFPPSTIYELEKPKAPDLPPLMTVTFLGLTGPSGVLPRHYTELLIRLDLENRTEGRRDARYALRAWLDQFNHRIVSLFYRAWEKYRFHIVYEGGGPLRGEPDAFTRALFSFVGLGTPALRERLRVTTRVEEEGRSRERLLAEIDDLALLYYGGLLAQRPRTAVGLAQLLRDYFELPVEVQQFRGRWLRLDPGSQTRLGAANCAMGLNAVAGERVWDVQSKFRVRVGPLRYDQFRDFMPDGGALLVLGQLARTYAGPDLDFDVLPVLRGDEAPRCRLGGDGADGSRLGWNTWVHDEDYTENRTEAVFFVDAAAGGG